MCDVGLGVWDRYICFGFLKTVFSRGLCSSYRVCVLAIGCVF